MKENGAADASNATAGRPAQAKANIVADLNKKSRRKEQHAKSGKSGRGGKGGTKAQGNQGNQGASSASPSTTANTRHPNSRRRKAQKPRKPKQVSILGARKLEKEKAAVVGVEVLKRADGAKGSVGRSSSGAGVDSLLAEQGSTELPVQGVNLSKGGLGLAHADIWKRETPVFVSKDPHARPQQGKLVTEKLGFAETAFTRNQSDNCQYRVVGVVGPQGVGKSTFILELKKAMKSEAVSPGDEIFQVETEEDHAYLRHRTQGIDGCFVETTTEKLLLLDTQPLLSASVCLDLIRDNAEIPFGLESHMELATLQSLQLVVFLLSVCHSVVVIQHEDQHSAASEVSVDSALWRLIRLGLMVKTESITKSGGTHCADLLLLSENKKLLHAWRAYLEDILPSEDVRPRANIISRSNTIGVLKYLDDSFEARCEREKRAESIAGGGVTSQPDEVMKQASEKEWFVFSRKLWNSFAESKTLEDLKHLLHQSEMNIL